MKDRLPMLRSGVRPGLKSALYKWLVLGLLFFSCQKSNSGGVGGGANSGDFVSAVDISAYPEIAESNPIFYDAAGNRKDFLEQLKSNGINTVRLRLWVNPAKPYSGFPAVKQFALTLKSKGFRIWLTLHYSDTWADPGQQETPKAWQGISFPALKDTVRDYTLRVMRELNPNYIQIGNEINSGMLHPSGNINTNRANFIELLKTGAAAVRSVSPTTKIIVHFAGIENSAWFFNQVSSVDYDWIGLSYYPIWHGKSLSDLQQTMLNLSTTHQKGMIICETAYPFTLGWKDWTNNIVGLPEQLIPGYAASPEGQQRFIQDIRKMVKALPRGIGLCYWGAELIAWKGTQATDASPWENQALFDFNQFALPALSALKDSN